MPQVIVRYRPSAVSSSAIHGIRDDVRMLVAEAASTEGVKLDLSDVDWVPQAYEPAAMAPNLAIEIRTIGFPERKAKMNRSTILDLKKRIMELPDFPSSCRRLELLIWVQFTDPDGVHV